MAIPLGPDWNRLYDQGKCLERGVPFTDEQQAELFKVRGDEIKKWELIRKRRAEFEVKKLEDPTQVQARENAKAISEAMKKAVTDGKTSPKANNGDNSAEINLEEMKYQDLLAKAKELGVETKSQKKADVIEAIKAYLDKKDGE